MAEKLSAGGVRFVRIRGKIIPIRTKTHGEEADQQYKERSRKAIKASAVGGLAAGAYVTGAYEAAVHAIRKQPKLVKSRAGFAIGALALSTGASGYSFFQRIKAEQHKPTFSTQIREGLKETASFVGGLAGAVGTYALIKRGGKKLKPHAQKFGEYLRYLKAKPVTATVIGKLLK